MHEVVSDKLQRAAAIIARLQTRNAHEPLIAILGKLGDSAYRMPASVAERPISEPTARANEDFMGKHGLTDDDLASASDLAESLHDLLTPRARKALLLKLCACVKKHGWEWKHDTLAATAGQSASYMTIRKDVFPNLVPSGPMLLIRGGRASVASGLLCLALQGVPSDEVAFMGLADIPDVEQRDFAGKAFIATVCLAHVVGAMIELFPSR